MLHRRIARPARNQRPTCTAASIIASATACHSAHEIFDQQRSRRKAGGQRCATVRARRRPHPAAIVATAGHKIATAYGQRSATSRARLRLSIGQRSRGQRASRAPRVRKLWGAAAHGGGRRWFQKISNFRYEI
ncbi:hypothetical protein F511_45102 [Dorcoceras hygrometricum]|uniref:Uncharacterized protein n=1 Tax=Dorcoceras hygrometricum TaxID=472368 RepID=A0A2Z6ZY41_9LAMI|nr:hypothetical protein F511_45102 [Dorcoceras hygrometricum]